MERAIHTKFDIYACILTLSMITKNYPDRFPDSATFHISQIGILVSWAYGTSDLHQMWYLCLCNNSKCDYWILFISVNRANSNILKIYMTERVLKYRPGLLTCYLKNIFMFINKIGRMQLNRVKKKFKRKLLFETKIQISDRI